MQQLPQGGLLLTLALTSALVGITEPIEFLFAFTAPWLFLAHALLTGLSLAICSGLDIQVGSYFSAGLLDLVLSYHAGLHSFWLIPWASSSSSSMPCSSPGCWNTPPSVCRASPSPRISPGSRPWPPPIPRCWLSSTSRCWGHGHLQAMSVCLTRLSLRVRDMALVDQSCLARLGCLSWIVLNEHQLVLVLGPMPASSKGRSACWRNASRSRSVSNRLRLPLASTSDQAKGRRSATKSIRLRRAGARCSRLG